MSQPVPATIPDRRRFHARRRAFRDWRRSRPFWGGVTAILAGIELYAVTAVPSLALVVIQGVAGIAAIVLGLSLIILAVTTWFQPQLRVASGLLIVLLSLASILLTNLGGFLLGMLLGLHSGASIASWRPHPGRSGRRLRRRRNPAAPEPAEAIAPQDGFGPLDALRPSDPAGPPDPAEPADPAEPSGPAAPVDGTPPLEAPPGAPQRRNRPGSSQSFLGVGLLAAGLLVAPAAHTAAPASDSLFCTLLPLLCPSASPSPAATSTGTATPTPSPTSTPTPSATTTPGPAPSGSAGPLGTKTQPSGTATPAVSATGSDRIASTGPTTAATAAGNCRAGLVPGGRIALGSSAAGRAASVLAGCLAAQRAGTVRAAAVTAGAAAGRVPVLSADLTRITADQETMTGLGYAGVTTLRTAAGPQQALAFTASSVRIDGIREQVALPQGRMTLSAGSTVTLSGNVHLYVVSLSGNVFGLLPLTISPASPPPLVLPYMVFTGVDSQLAYLDAQSLSAPGGLIAVG